MSSGTAMDTKPEGTAEDAEKAKTQAAKDSFCNKVSALSFMAVWAHTLNLQTEAIMISRACSGDLARASKFIANGNLLGGLLGLVVNSIGGKLSDSFGRKMFFSIGPLVQCLTGLLSFSFPDNAAMLVLMKTLRMVCTTFSGTVMSGTGLRDTFDAPSGELKNMELKVRSKLSLAIIVGPLCEAMILKRVQAGGERVTYLCLSFLGMLATMMSFSMSESLGEAQRKAFVLADTLRAANPFAFLRIYSQGSPLLAKLATIFMFQNTIDGKCMSDMTQIWLREHLKIGIEGIRNFVMGYGLASALAGEVITKPLTNKMSAYAFTTFTNITNLLAFFIRGSAEVPALFFGALPVMLPGCNGNSAMAILPLMSELAKSDGFGVGESGAFFNNMRQVLGALATFLYGYFYSACKARGINAGWTFAFAGLMGAALPQAILMLTVKQKELEFKKANA